MGTIALKGRSTQNAAGKESLRSVEAGAAVGGNTSWSCRVERLEVSRSGRIGARYRARVCLYP